MPLEILIQQLATELTTHKLMLATAESCTGGGLSYYLTSLAGSSDWFERGFVTYSNEAKIEMLGVSATTLDAHGAVSKEVAEEMAKGVLQHSRANISIAITGVAGPAGGSKDKPVGTVWFAWAKRNGQLLAEKYKLSGNREQVRVQSIEIAIKNLLLWL